MWPFEVLANRAWQPGENVSASDAPYIALAERLAAALVTSDVRLARATGLRCAVELFG